MSLILLCVTACSGKKEDDREVKNCVQTAIDLFKQGDIQKFSQVFTDDARYINFSTKDSISGGYDIADWCIDTTSGQEKIVLDEISMKDADHAYATGSLESDQLQKIALGVELVKKDGTWLIEKVRSVNVEKALSHYEMLKGLEFLVGKRVFKDDAVVMNSDCSWDENKNFLKQQFLVSIIDQKELQCEQIIGWDPASKTIRSWIFDSDGGFGSGNWFKKDNGWYVKVHYTIADGRQGVSTNIYTKLDDNTYTFTSIGREIDGQLLPNIGPYKVDRTQARPL